MKIKNTLPACLALAMGISIQAHASEEDLKQARELVKQYAGQLQPALGQAMKSGGPVAAIDVCKTKAPEIASQISEQSGWEINRVSLKNRSPKGEPDAWERVMLSKFEAQLANGATPNELEHYSIVRENGETQYRYMRAIVIGANQPCLHCHGSAIADPIKQKLSETYPNDKATGYQTGQIRGAFSFKKSL